MRSVAAGIIYVAIMLTPLIIPVCIIGAGIWLGSKLIG